MNYTLAALKGILFAGCCISVGLMFGSHFIFWCALVYIAGAFFTYRNVRDSDHYEEDPIEAAFAWPLWWTVDFAFHAFDRADKRSKKDLRKIKDLCWHWQGITSVSEPLCGQCYRITQNPTTGDWDLKIGSSTLGASSYVEAKDLANEHWRELLESCLETNEDSA